MAAPLLSEASPLGQLSAVQVLLAKGANLNAGNPPALIGAADKGHLAVVKVLLAQGADVNKKGTGLEATALMYAAARLAKGQYEGTDGDVEQPGGSLPIVQALLANGANMELTDAIGGPP